MSETGLEPEAWIYASVVVPIVISVSPVGALVSSFLHRQVIASFLYVLDTIAIVSQKNQSPFYRVTDGTRYLPIPIHWEGWHQILMALGWHQVPSCQNCIGMGY
jgi:hypothetical protein